MGKGMITRVRSLLALLVVLAGCALEDDSIARVGDRVITAQDVQAFINRLPESAGASREELKDHLQTIIDFELMLMEARSQGIGTSSAYLARMNRIRQAKLVGEYERRSVHTTMQEGELEDYIAREKFDRAIRLGDIVVADLETAENVVGRIEAGASFADIARQLSLNERTAAQGGDSGEFRAWNQMIPYFADKLFALEVGAVSEPVQAGGEKYVIFKILDERAIQLNEQRLGVIAGELEKEKHRIAKAKLVAELADQYNVEPNPDGIAATLQALRAGSEDLASEPSAVVLFRYDGGEITAADLIVAADRRNDNDLEKLRNPEEVISFAQENIFPDKMFQEAAVRLGIDREEAVVQWLEQQAQQKLAEALRSSVLRKRVNITEDDLRQYYEANSHRLLHPEQTEVQEILVGTESEALRLKGMIVDGASLGALAKKHSIRSREVRDDEGVFHVHRHESPQFGGFVEAAVEAEIGELTGPVEVQEGYSIFKVISRERRRESFSEAELRVRSQLTRQRRRDTFNEYMAELRSRYAPEVTINEDRLAAALTVQ